MKKFLVLLSAVVMVLGFAGKASAISFVDVDGDQSGSVYIADGGTATWTFDLDNDSLAVGDVSASDIIDSAFLTILFWDSSADTVTELEFGLLTMDGDTTATGEIDTGVAVLSVLGYVIADHELVLDIASISGDFTVTTAILQGEYSAVPEPSTLLLLGVGFLGLGIMLRRKNRTALL